MSIRFVVIALFALVTGFAMPRPADAAVTTSFSDAWWNPDESGWGANISQQADVLFVSLFVYGPNTQPIWYSIQLTYSGQSANGDLLFVGDAYVTTGPWFGGAFDPSQVGIRRVGGAIFTATSVTSGTLAYTVDGVSVLKSLVRQTLKAESLAGTYLGGITAVRSSCTNPAFDGTVLTGVSVTVAHSGSNFQMDTVDAKTGNRCTYNGTYNQDGQMGRVLGSYTCTSGELGSFSFFEVQSSISGFMGRFIAPTFLGTDSCNVAGRLAAAKATF